MIHSLNVSILASSLREREREKERESERERERERERREREENKTYLLAFNYFTFIM